MPSAGGLPQRVLRVAQESGVPARAGGSATAADDPDGARGVSRDVRRTEDPRRAPSERGPGVSQACRLRTCATDARGEDPGCESTSLRDDDAARPGCPSGAGSRRPGLPGRRPEPMIVESLGRGSPAEGLGVGHHVHRDVGGLPVRSWRWSSMRSVARSSAGRWPRTCGPSAPRSGNARSAADHDLADEPRPRGADGARPGRYVRRKARAK